MNFLTVLHSSNSDAPSAAFAAFEISPAAAGKLLALHARCIAFVKELQEEDLSDAFADVTLDSNSIVLFDAQSYAEELSELLRANDDNEIVMRKEMPFANDGSDTYVRTECHGVRLCSRGVIFTALPKSGEDDLSTPTIPLEVLRVIAAK
jgi:hypothetical protein